ncbi:free fatty acid receptor 2-like [Salvelinus fontinalis]|uniref:free fatty acid receptor 2-like n=1 Tax=Salvelinus fontinalis TaxID=8038 RepID=UPI002485FCB5|nr:free fatty acid receptor 2-like [Salvelinus fontinalis]
MCYFWFCLSYSFKAMVWVKSEVILSIYIITFLIGLPANILALYAFSVKIHKKPTPTDIFLLNLIVSDLLFLLFLPLKMYEAASGMQWYLPEFLCSITSYTFFSTIYTSSLLLMAVSVVRYLAVAFPITYRQLHKPFYSVVASTIIWLLTTAHCSIVFIIQHHPDLSQSNTSVCYENFTEQQLAILLPVRLEFFVMLCLVPLMVCIFCYLRCIWILYMLPRISPGQKQKAIGMALGTLAVFLVCVFPYNFSHVLGFFTGRSPPWRYYTLLLSAFNTCLDPIIFYFSSSTFRITIKMSICKMLGLRQGQAAIQRESTIANIGQE